ncbi:hypothetical protein HN51_027636 [Arachis hypogaea]
MAELAECFFERGSSSTAAAPATSVLSASLASKDSGEAMTTSSPASKSLCIETPTGRDVFTMREIGVKSTVGISRKAVKPLVKSGRGHRIPFPTKSFDFIFSGEGSLERSPFPAESAAEVSRTLKPEGFAVFHLVNPNDTYSFNSFLDLFDSCFVLVKSRYIKGFDSSMPQIWEIVLKKECDDVDAVHKLVKVDYFGSGEDDSSDKCSVPEYKHDIVKNAEPLIPMEPLKPWITLKRNLKKTYDQYLQLFNSLR